MPLPPIGARVRVPIGPRIVSGCVVGHDAVWTKDTTARDVVEVVDMDPFLPASIVDLCRWVADYYVSGVGDAVGVAMPPGARLRASGFRTQRIVGATTLGIETCRLSAVSPAQPAAGRAPDRRRELTPKQAGAMRLLVAAPEGLPAAGLRQRGFGVSVIGGLVARGYAVVRDERHERDPFDRSVMAGVVPDPLRELTDEQAVAFSDLARLAEAGEFRVALLHGVTGSGKTEVYLRLAERTCRAGRQVLLLVPEIALTPSIATQVRGMFGTRVAIQHSALSDGERHDQWQRIRRGDIDVVVGTRSAVFAPLDRLGLVIVDEEHDGSYKQEESPRYHGRDVAIVRASREGALVVLGSATPSMETYQHAVTGKYAHVVLTRRVLDRPLAQVRVVNMRDEYAEHGPEVVISRPLRSAIEDRLARQEQVLVLLNRRGYSTAVFCRQCGDTFECPNCSISLTVHTARHGWRARCHYCNYAMTVPKACRSCAAPYLEQSGVGTEKVEQQMRGLFPAARIGRIDRDSVRLKGTLAAVLSRFATGELDILVGTQMIAKGHDFPRVTLVGVISADVGLGMADFRAGERTFQLLTQVAGRAGRGARAGEAVIQTLYPEHYSIQLACSQNYTAFFDREIAYRRGMSYPPLVALINVIVRGHTLGEAMNDAADVVARLESLSALSGFTLLGPAPAPLGRLRGEYRVQFFLKGARRTDMRGALRTVVSQMPDIRKRLTIDIDPQNIL
jgi:primosomal protein N' (replication factor Y)